MLTHQGRSYVSNVDDFMEQILEKSHSSRYSIHPGPPRCTMIYEKSISAMR